jgi:hypothetical protein
LSDSPTPTEAIQSLPREVSAPEIDILPGQAMVHQVKKFFSRA